MDALTSPARQTTRRGAPRIEAYSVDPTTAAIEVSAFGSPAVRVLYRRRDEGEGSFTEVIRRGLGGRAILTGLTPATWYVARAEDSRGRVWDVPFQTPLEATHQNATQQFVCRLVCQDRQGRLIANTRLNNGASTIRRSADGGRTWTDILPIAYGWHIYCHGDYIYGTTIAGWALSYKDRLWRIQNVPGQSGNPEIVMGPMFRYPTFDPGTVTYPWAFEPRGPYWIVGASSQYDPYGTWPGGWNENDYGNRIYYTSNNWQTWSEMKAPPVPVPSTPTFPSQLYTRHMHAICWNPVSGRYFVSHGDGRRCNYVVSGDLSEWQLVSNGWRYTNANREPSGASIGITWLPDGTWLAGNDDSFLGHITKFWPDGRWQIVLETGYYGASMIWDIWAYDDGEVWATGTVDGGAVRLGCIWVSLDWGETWRLVHKNLNAAFQPRWIAGCHETRRLHGQYVMVDQMPERELYPAWVWERYRTNA